MLPLVVLLLAAASGACAAGNLTIVQATIQQGEGGSPVPPGFAHAPGEVIYFSFQVENYRVSPAQKVQLSTRVEALDPHGVPLTEPIESKVDTDLAPEDKGWKPKVGHEIAIPPEAGSGTYRIKVQVKDELASATAEKEVAFEVRGHPVEPSDTLVIRNFRFYRSENDTEPLARPAYRPGDTVWARFDLTGYKFGPGNQIDVSYRVSVLSPSGKVLWSQPEAEAVVEKTRSFYPKRYVPGFGSLSLQPTIRPGDYAIVVSARDAIGGQTFETRQTFSIE
ncbi:MAG TPA: hypothetical protein VFA33_01355 [Bryobacteraceae bacterium]|nr:hypothetical protein [Bryobacteraceae bacterium]